MSLLTICQDTADVIGLARPTAIITGSDQLARQMLGLAKETLFELSLMDWPVLQIPYTFSTVVGQSQYAIPADFEREIGDTMYAASQYEHLRGSLTPGDWARQRSTFPSSIGRFKFRIYGLPLKFNIIPVPQRIEPITLEYQTNYRVVQTGGAFATNYFDDTDVSLVPEDLMKRGLKWRLRRAKGLDYSEEFDDYETARAQRFAQQLSLGSMPVATRGLWDGSTMGIGYVPESGFGV